MPFAVAFVMTKAFYSSEGTLLLMQKQGEFARSRIASTN
jgi:hypothetical protein